MTHVQLAKPDVAVIPPVALAARLGAIVHPRLVLSPNGMTWLYWTSLLAVTSSAVPAFAVHSPLATMKFLPQVLIILLATFWHLQGAAFAKRMAHFCAVTFVEITGTWLILSLVQNQPIWPNLRVASLLWFTSVLASYAVWMFAGWFRSKIYTRDPGDVLLVVAASCAATAAATPVIMFVAGRGIALGIVFEWWLRSFSSVTISALTILTICEGIRDRRAVLRSLPSFAIITAVAIGFFVVAMQHADNPVGWIVLAPALWASLVLPRWLVAVHALVVSITVAGAYMSPAVYNAQTAPSFNHIVSDLLITGYVIACMVLVSARSQRGAISHQLRIQSAEQRAQAELLNATFEGITNGILVTNADGRIEFANAMATFMMPRQLLEMPAQELCAQFTPVTELDVPPSDYWEAMAGGETPEFRLHLEGDDDDPDRTYSIKARPLPAALGRQAILVISDITANERHLDELEGFASTAAHDLRSPLTALHGWLELGLDSEDPAMMRQMLSKSLSTTERLNKDIEEWLSYAVAREGELRPEPLDLHPLMADLRATYSHANITSRISHVPLGDAVLVRQVITNLVSNAVKYAPAGSTPTIEVATQTDDNPHWIRIDVEDRGKGLDTDELETVFDPYYKGSTSSTDVRSTGLGLALCRRIVRRHGGHIWVTRNDSREPGMLGNTFSFTLPLV